MREPPSNIQNGLLKCNLGKTNQSLFFSLVDCRNNLFTSNDPKKIMEFYDGFENREQLIQWMKERPKGVSYIHEVEGDKDIIVVIPTADFNGKYARECRDNIFKGLHMVFVESGGRADFYFNYAHNCNVGIKRAIEYNPKWVVVSNDDLYEIDKNDILRKSLLQIDRETIDTVFVTPTAYHSYDAELSKSTIYRAILFIVLGKLRIYQLRLEKKFNVKYFLSPKRLSYTLFYRGIIRVQYIGNIGIFSSNFIKNHGDLFDEISINGGEDLDLSLSIKSRGNKIKFINYRIGDYLGSWLGKNTPEGIRNLKGTPRRLRDIANMSYLNYKIENEEEYKKLGLRSVAKFSLQKK
jgi:hypothetical protein